MGWAGRVSRPATLFIETFLPEIGVPCMIRPS